MPTYEYECEAGHRFEKVQKMSEDALTQCEICGVPVERLISRSAFILKGGGWYANDYTKSSTPATGSTPEAAPSSTPPSTSGSSGAGGDTP